MCNQLKDTNAFAAYEKAIEGYQFQVGRYNTWMNYYAIFVGALFIALYSVWAGNGCCKCPTDETTATGENVKFLLALISIIGWVASMCWYGALLGYRKWNGHWMGVIKTQEKTLIAQSYPAVYTDMPEPKKPSHRCVAGYISTQKMTGTFIFFVALAWAAVLTFIADKYDFGTVSAKCVGITIGSITVGCWALLHWVNLRLYCSSIPRK